ncbi:hypothetical protein AAKU67_000709 [Oxalobacteraceae bacterium GrIS 2.11]
MFSISRNHWYSRTYQITEADISKARSKAAKDPQAADTGFEQLWQWCSDLFTPAVQLEARQQLETLFAAQGMLRRTDLGVADRSNCEEKVYRAFFHLKSLATPDCEENFISEGNQLRLVSRQYLQDLAELEVFRECPQLDEGKPPALPPILAFNLRYVNCKSGSIDSVYKLDASKESRLKLIQTALAGRTKLSATTTVEAIHQSCTGIGPLKIRELLLSLKNVAEGHIGSGRQKIAAVRHSSLIAQSRIKQLMTLQQAGKNIDAERQQLIVDIHLAANFLQAIISGK